MNRKSLISVTALIAAFSASTLAMAQARALDVSTDDIASPLPTTPPEGPIAIAPTVGKETDRVAPKPRPVPAPPGDDGFCKADTNKDKIVHFVDLFGFLELYFAGDKLADMNGDGTIGYTDIYEYIDHFVTGC